MPSWRKVTLNDLGPELGIDLQVPQFDVTDQRHAGGAKGDGVTDDTVAFRAAFAAAVAANGTVVWPQPQSGGFWKITDTITVGTLGGSPVRCNVECRGGDFNRINYMGAGSKSVFAINELKDSTWSGVKINIPSGTSPSSLRVIDVNGSSTAANVFSNCTVRDNSTGTNNILWSFAHNVASNDISALTFLNCGAEGHNDASSVGWSLEGGNIKGMEWFGGGAAFCGTGFSNRELASDGVAHPGGDFQWYGCNGSNNQTEFKLAGAGNCNIIGGRWENGKRFLDVTNSSGHFVFTIYGVNIDNFTPSDGIIVYLFSRPFVGRIDNIKITGPQNANCFYLRADTSGPGVLAINGTVGATAANTAVATIVDNATGWFDLDWHVQLHNASSQSLGFAPVPDAPTALTYSSSITPNAARKGPYTIAATNGTAFTINAPNNPTTGQVITFDIKNSSGGAHGVITWAATYLNGGAGTVGAGAFAGIANGKRRTISFYYDGTNWIELYRTADI